MLAESAEDNGITKLLSRVILKGTKTRTAEQLADQIEAVGGAISSDAGNNSFSVAAQVMQPDLKLGLDILADVLLNPTFPRKAIAREKEIQLAGIKHENETDDLHRAKPDATQPFPGHPTRLRANGTPESVGKLERAQLAAV